MNGVTYGSAIAAVQDLGQARLFGGRESRSRRRGRTGSGSVATCKHEEAERADKQDGGRSEP